MTRACAIGLLLACGGVCAACSSPSTKLTPSAEVDSLILEGEEQYRQGDHAGARDFWMRALQSIDSADDRSEPRILTWLALLNWREGNYAEARTIGERALAMKRERGLSEDLFASYNALGLIAWHEGSLRESANLFDRALEAASSTADPSARVRVLNNLANVRTDLGKFHDARRLFEEAYEGSRRLDDARIEAAIASNLAMLDIRIGDPLAAIQPLLTARARLHEGGHAAEELNVLGQLGTAYIAVGEPQRAFVAFDSALAKARELGMQQEEASSLEWLAVLYRELGDLRRTLEHYSAAQALNERLGLSIEAGTVQRSQAEVLASLGHRASARASAEAALARHRASEARLELLFDLLLLSELAAEDGDRDGLSTYLGEARAVTAQLDVHRARAALALTEARIAERSGTPMGVLDILGHAWADVSLLEAGRAWEPYALRARALAAIGRLEDAVEASRDAVAAVEHVRANVDVANLRTTFSSERAALYGDLMAILLRLGRTREAFQVADASRGRALLEHLGAARSTLRAGTPVHDLLEGEDLLRRIDVVTRALAEAQDEDSRFRTAPVSDRAADLKNQLADLRSRYEAHLVRASTRDSSSAALLGLRPASVSEVQQALHPDEALVQFVVLPEYLVAFVITSDGLAMHKTRVAAEELRSRVRLARQLLADPEAGAGDGSGVATALREVLFGSLDRDESLTRTSHLLIVPDPLLAYLPFAALQDRNSGRLLSEEFVVTQLPSAAALPALRSRIADQRPRGSAVFAPFPERLPGTLREARAFRRVMPGAELRRGRWARESALREALASRAVVHVATHGVLNTRNPMFTRIEMARGRGTTADDGRFEVHEILGAIVRSDLVFLSGCETGLGAAGSTYYARTEDYSTLGQAFLYAGARAVIATLWPIEDAGAAAFAARFYEHLHTLPASAALAAAQRDLQRDPRYDRPYYWAGYVLMGDGDPTPGAKPSFAAVQ